MNESQIRQKVVDVVTGWVGLKESDGSHKQIIDIYNAQSPLPSGYRMKYTDSWCAATVSAAFITAGMADIAPTECSCERMIKRFKAINRWEEFDNYRPSPGDIIMYDWQDSGVGDNTGWADHVGIVVSVVGSTIKVVEGNMSNAVGYRTLQVGGKNIRGYCLPDFASKATGKPTVKPVVSKPATSKPSAGVAVKNDVAKYFSKAYAKTYTVTSAACNMRSGGGLGKRILRTLKKGDKVVCYGYYNKGVGRTWLYVQDKDGNEGYCSTKCLGT